MLIRRFSFTMAFVFAISSAHSATRYEVRLPGSSGAPHYWVVILARPAGVVSRTPGHAFVEFGYEDDKLHSTRYEAWGFYPGDGSKSFRKVPGKIADDVRDGSLSAQTVLVNVAVPRDLFNAAMAVEQQWSARPPEYQLFTAKNCIDFVDAVATSLGLQTPDRTKLQLPVDYVRALGSANK